MKRYLFILLILILTISSAAAFADDADVNSWQQMDDAEIGTLTGSLGGPAIEENLPDAEIFYYDTITDLLLAAQSGKVDAICYDDSVFKFAKKDIPNLRILDGYLIPSEYAPIFPKNDKGKALADQYSEFVKKLWADGTIAEIDAVWFGDDDSLRTVLDYENLPDTNGTLHMAADLSQVPFVMMSDNRIVGYDVDIAARFCEANGYRLVIEPMTFESIIPAVVSEKYDFAASNFTITEERKESVYFSEPVYRGGLVIAVLDKNAGNSSAAGSTAEKSEKADRIPEFSDFSELSGKTVSMLTGAPFEELVRSKVPDVGKFTYFNNIADIILALKAGKTDACLNNNAVAQLAVNRDPKIALFPEDLEDSDFGFAFAKGDPDREKWEAAFETIDEDTIRAVWEKWTGSDESLKVLPEQDWQGLNGTVKAAVCDTVEPMSYAGKGGTLMGFDIEMILLMAKELDVHVEFTGMEFSAILAAVQSGKAKLGAGSIIVTDEREEAVDFIDYYPAAFVLVVRSVSNRETDTKDLSAGKTDLSLDDLNGKLLGVQTGSSFGPMLESKFPDSKISYFNSNTDLVTALTSNKIVSFPVDEPVIRYIMSENDKITYIPDYLEPFEFGCVFRKNDEGKKLRDEFDEFIGQIQADGTLDEMQNIWFGADESKKVLPDLETLPGPNGVLTMATEALYPPFEYISGEKVVGYEIDLAIRFCEKYGYKLEIQNMSLDAVLPSIQSGKYNFGCSGFTITEERAESVYFSEPDYSGGVVMAVLNSGKTAASDSGISDGYDQLPAGKYRVVNELDGKKIGVQTGTNFDDMVKGKLPNADVLYFNTKADMVGALQTGKIEAFAIDEPVVQLEMQQNSDLTYIPDYLDTYDFAYVFPNNDKGEKIKDDLNEYLEQAKADGTLAAIEDKWVHGDESQWTIADYKSFPAENGVIRLATNPEYEPFGFIYNNEIVGYEIDVIVQFCEAFGYGLELVNMSFDAILPSIQAGKYEIGAAGLTLTDERAQSVKFSDSYYHGGTVLTVLKQTQPAVSAAQSSVDASSYPAGEYSSLAELAGKRIGVQMGTIFDKVASENIPNAEILYFNNFTDEVTALKEKKIDGLPTTEMIFSQFHQQNGGYTIIDDSIGTIPTAFVFPKTEKGAQLQTQMNEFLNGLRENGELDRLKAVWSGTDESQKVMPDYKSLPDTNGRLRFVTEGDFPPFDYVRDEMTVGYDVDIAARFCEKYGYALDVDIMNFSALMPAIQTGKYDFAASGITITDERKESVLFSDPNIEDGIVVMVRVRKDPGVLLTIWNSISNSFERTFIRENRYRLFLQGILTTMLITVLSILLGTVLGFLIFMLCRNGNRFANGVTHVCFWIVQGMPGVVLLMILFYVIFGSVAISGITVAVIGFTLTFGASVFGLLKMGVGAVDTGQYEAAYALGYSNTRTFFRIILPQAIPHVVDAYKGEIISLLKGTAIVGYIAVQDLTKMGDIVRSRTYEAFFPLIAVTIIYFLLELLLGVFVSVIKNNIDPKRRSGKVILEGVNTNDQN